MTRVLIVQRDPAVAARIAEDLGAAGYETELCGGPQHEPCPVVEALPCPLVDRADVLVYDAWVAGGSDAGEQLIAELRDVYVDLPVVLTSVDPSLDWVVREGPGRVFPLTGEPDARVLADTIETALADQGMAV
jgi:hypothetical protein